MAQSQFDNDNKRLTTNSLLIAFLCFISTFTAHAKETTWSSSTYERTPSRLIIANLQPTAEPKDASKETTRLPPHIDLNLIGQASFSYLFWDVYDSYLFGPEGAVFSANFGDNFPSDATAKAKLPLSLVITYKRDIKASDLIDSTKEQWQHLGIPSSEFEPYLPILRQWPNLSKGDELALVVYADFSVFFYNQKFLSLQENPQFGFDFVSIWLSPKTSEPKLRKKLLSHK